MNEHVKAKENKVGVIRHRLLIGTVPIVEPQRSEWIIRLDTWRNNLPEQWRRLIIGPVESVVNQEWWVVFLPDGSKEYWADSEQGWQYAREFAALFTRPYDQPVELTFGDEDPAAQTGLSWGEN
jgi:hypothetical protein